ncbi:MAG: aminotransferase class V-fold PLP-dependent enzyme [Planctomycetota bacterium]|nr:MAG: aminotransferase class V-fold PLP-dependent enzyme [Planctomycetota bacterium]
MVRAIPDPSAFARDFRLDPSVVYLNHGSFGACPVPVQEAQRRHRDRVEADAVRFYVDDLWPLMDRSRDALAPVVGCDARDLVFVHNATTGVATVLHNLELRAGDEILVTNNEYTACMNNCRAVAARAGATVVAADLPWPMPGPDAAFDAVMARVTDRTRVAMISLVTSATGIRLPAERIIAALGERGIETILDAAHGPGCVPMDLDAWSPAWATGNCHKWLCSPKGAAFLFVRRDRQDGFRPLVLSNDAERLDAATARTRRPHFHHEFDYAGTDDMSPYLTVADAAAYLSGVMDGGIEAVMAANHALCVQGRDIVCDALGVQPPAPESMLGPMATLTLPAGAPDAETLKARLYDEWRIQIPVWGTPGGTTSIRLSAQIYNSVAQYEYLGEALRAELG